MSFPKGFLWGGATAANSVLEYSPKTIKVSGSEQVLAELEEIYPCASGKSKEDAEYKIRHLSLPPFDFFALEKE